MTEVGNGARDEIVWMTATQMSEAIRARELSPVEIVTALLDAVERRNDEVNAFITLLPEAAIADARAAEEALMSTPAEDLGRLHGVPIAVKDLTPTAGVRTTFGVKELTDNVPTADGVTWSRLKREGAVLLGKTATPPFGMLGVTVSDVHGRTNNPWNRERTVGGSSGGSAAALAAGFVPLATGSDGGGSIRVPAAYCGVVGHKPSAGRVPIYSEGNRFHTVDVVGPMARDVADCALMLSIMAGAHSRDPFSIRECVDFVEELRAPPPPFLRIAFSPDLGHGPVEPDVDLCLRDALSEIQERLAVSVDEVNITVPDPLDYFLKYWTPEVTLLLEGSDGLPPIDLSSNSKITRFGVIGQELSAVEYLRNAYEVREKTHEAFAKVFDDYDLLVTPTVPQVAFEHPVEGYYGPRTVAGQDVQWPDIDFFRFTEPPSHAGFPALSLPCGLSSSGLPVGAQIIGRHGADADVLRAALMFEDVLGIARMQPPNDKVTEPAGDGVTLVV